MRFTVNKPTTIVDKIDENGKRIHIEYGKCYKCDIRKQIDAIHKLGQLEDVEEICLKLRSQYLFEKTSQRICRQDYTKCNILYDFENNSICIYDYEIIWSYPMKEYGKTWALTREELL